MLTALGFIWMLHSYTSRGPIASQQRVGCIQHSGQRLVQRACADHELHVLIR